MGFTGLVKIMQNQAFLTDRVPHGMNNNFGFRSFVKDQIRIRRRYHSANGRIMRPTTNVRINHKKIRKSFDAALNPPRALRRVYGYIIEDRA